MNFASPLYALLLFVLPFIALLKIWSDARAQKAVQAFASSERLRPNFLGGASIVWSGLHFGLQILGLAFIIIALTRPHVGFEDENIPQSGRNIFITIDTSKSMLADDMTPNRLTRAKLAALDLIEKLPGERIGLIAFAGRAFLQVPLTTDHDAVRESIMALDHTTIPRGGSSLASAMDLGIKLIENAPGHRHGMVLFSDGQDTDEGIQRAAKEAAEKHLLILPVGMGTVEGSLIPDPDHPGEYVRDENGNVVNARLESELLRKVATIMNSKYIELSSQALTRDAVDALLSQLDTHMVDSRLESHPVERYQWPLGLGMICIIVSMLMRPSSRKMIKSPAMPVDPQTLVHTPAAIATVLMILLMMGGTHLQAASLDDAKQAQKAYDQGNFDEASRAYHDLLDEKKPPVNPAELAYGLGASAYQLKDYDRAIQGFSDALQSPDKATQKKALQGLGTSLYDQGASMQDKKPDAAIKTLGNSRDHFDSLLKMMGKNSPEYHDMKENYDFVQKQIEGIKKKQEQQKTKQKKKLKPDKDGKEKMRQPGNSEETEDENQPDNQENKDQEKNGTKPSEHDFGLKPEEKLPEGQLRTDENNKPEQTLKPVENGENERNAKTGFSPQEAIIQLRSYADDQKFNYKALQFLQRKEKPTGGKDY